MRLRIIMVPLFDLDADHAALGYRAPTPEVFVPAFATRSQPASPATPAVAQRPVMH